MKKIVYYLDLPSEIRETHARSNSTNSDGDEALEETLVQRKLNAT
jgi:hypothetical protein